MRFIRMSFLILFVAIAGHTGAFTEYLEVIIINELKGTLVWLVIFQVSYGLLLISWWLYKLYWAIIGY